MKKINDELHSSLIPTIEPMFQIVLNKKVLNINDSTQVYMYPLHLNNTYKIVGPLLCDVVETFL